MEKVDEAKSTCCGKCGHMHVKGTSCPKPFLTGKRHCRNRKNEDVIKGSLAELINNIESPHKFNHEYNTSDYLTSALYEIILNIDNAVETSGDLYEGIFKVGNIIYKYSIDNIDNPYEEGKSIVNISFEELNNPSGKNLPTGNAKENYIKILSTMYKIIVDFINIKSPEYIGISSLDKSGYWKIYNNLVKTNKLKGYNRKNSGLTFRNKQGDTGKIIILKKNKELKEELCCSRKIINEGPELIKESLISEGLLYHIDNNLPLRENTYRPLSDNYFKLFKEARKLYTEGLLKVKKEDAELLESNIGEFDVYNGVTVPLDYIFDIDELINEIKHRGKNIELNKPKRGGTKKFYVYVKTPGGNIKKISFGDTTGLKAKLNNPKARQSFAKRHNCANKNDKTKAGYWSCRLPRYAKMLGFKTSFGGFW